MKIRKHLLPRALQDACATAFLFLCIPTTFYFEIWIVLYEIHGASPFFILNIIIGLFLLFNIVGNLLATLMIDSSIFSVIFVPEPVEDENSSSDWHLCDDCGIVVPPRAWHCDTCRTCILKRDHHCIFTGTCIGHNNHRFFLMFLVHLFIATIYGSIYNTYFIWILNGDKFLNLFSLVKMIFPLLMIAFPGTSSTQYYLVIYLVNIVGFLFSGGLLIYHGMLVSKGSVTYDKKRTSYDLGLKSNMKVVFGQRWYLVWISPFINSKLIHNGINWSKNPKIH